MAGVSASRYRWGAAAWLLTLQFFVVETVVQLQLDLPYSRADDLVSTLGSGLSPAAWLMNASFVLQGVLIGAGTVLLRPLLLGAGGRIAPAFLAAAAVGVAVVGLVPQDGRAAVHEAGAGLYLVGGALALLALAYAVRPRSEALGTALAVLGLLGAAATVFFVAGVVSLLGEGGTERVAAYVLPVGLALAGALLPRLRDTRRPQGPSRRERRAQERAAAAERARERDAALEAAAGRDADRPAAPGTAGGTAGDTADDTAEVDDFDPEDPWAQPRRR
ncbi:DUF998 domain-containing protein [Geodermatophilus sp. SYSU D00758]